MWKSFFYNAIKLSLLFVVAVALILPVETRVAEAPKLYPFTLGGVVESIEDYTEVVMYLLRQFAPHLCEQTVNEYSALITQAAEKYELDPVWVSAMIWVESRFKTTAVSSAGALGLMQIMPSTARQFGVTPEQLNDPHTNIFLGTRYLARLRSLYNGDLDMATVAYNQGMGNVSRGTYNRSYLVRVSRQYAGMRSTLNQSR